MYNFFFLIRTWRYVNRAGRKGVQTGRKTVRVGRSTLGDMPSGNTVVDGAINLLCLRREWHCGATFLEVETLLDDLHPLVRLRTARHQTPDELLQIVRLDPETARFRHAVHLQRRSLTNTIRTNVTRNYPINTNLLDYNR